MKKTIALLLSLLIALSCTAAAFADDAAAEDPEAWQRSPASEESNSATSTCLTS